MIIDNNKGNNVSAVVQNNPLVSVIIPTYKRADRLPVALQSVLSQTYKNIEVIVVNDNDPDTEWDKSTEELLVQCARQDNRLTFIHTKGSTGGGAARNYGCHNAKGEYLAFLDDDDEFMPDKIETQLSFMLANHLDMCWQDISWYNENGKLIEHRRLNHCNDFSKQGLLRAHLLTAIAPTSIYMLKRSLFLRTEGFGEVATGQDWWLMLRCIEIDAKIGYMPGVHVHQYLHSGGRLSLGQNKIDGETIRHEYVRQYYPILSKKDIRYVEFRHNAVLAFACKRSGRLIDALYYALRAIVASPSSCIKKGFDFFIRSKR